MAYSIMCTHMRHVGWQPMLSIVVIAMKLAGALTLLGTFYASE